MRYHLTIMRSARLPGQPFAFTLPLPCGGLEMRLGNWAAFWERPEYYRQRFLDDPEVKRIRAELGLT